MVRAAVPGYDPEVTAPDPALAALEWILDANGPLLELTSPAGHGSRRVGSDLIDQVASRVVRWRRADDTTPTHVLLPEVLEEVSRLKTVLRHHNYTEAVGRSLHGLLAEVLQLAGWLSIDQGRRKTGERCYREGLAAARIAGDRVLAAQLLSCDAYQRASRGDDVLLVAQAALHGAGEVPPLVRILFQERVAWAAVQIGNESACRSALADVDDTYALVGTAPEPDWTYWLDRGESDVMAARCLLRLGEPSRAAALLRPAIAAYPDHPREKALYLSWLAQAYLDTGQADAAESVVEEIEALEVKSHRLRMRLRELQR
jgi:tetratricopeptide (TPR) repeat protein